MKSTRALSAALAAALALTSHTTTAQADSNLGAFAVGAAVGALVNNQIRNNRQQQQQVQRRTYSTNSYTRQQNREVQAALNSFGFNAGSVDGALGQQSRTAISSYQAYMGYPVSGYLEEYQRASLVSGHHRLNAGGGSAYPEVVANEGTRGLLKAFADPNYASRYAVNQGATTTAFAAAPAPAPQPAPVPAPPTETVSLQPVTPQTLAPLNLTDVSTGSSTGQSMLRYCDRVEGATRANKGLIQASNLTDPDQALGEQFCEARNYAVDQLNALSAAAGLDEAQLVTACDQISDAMSDVTALVDRYGVQDIASNARVIVDQLSGGDMDTATGYGQLCLGMGYREDNPEMALTGAIVMLATNKPSYAEYVGHHLRRGFGTQEAPLQASAWYNSALSAMAQGASPAVLSADTVERNAVINAAVNVSASGLPAVKTSGSLPALKLKTD